MASNSSTLSECWRLNQVLCLLREYLKCKFLDPRCTIFLGKKYFLSLFLSFLSSLLFLFLLYLHIPSLHLLFLFSFTLTLLVLLCCWVGKKLEKLKTRWLFMIKREADIQRKHLVYGKKKVGLEGEVCRNVELNVTWDFWRKRNV